jgi:hypothetical protein
MPPIQANNVPTGARTNKANAASATACAGDHRPARLRRRHSSAVADLLRGADDATPETGRLPGV